MRQPLRIGQGYDLHRLVPDRGLVLGGVQIPFEKGLAGHSDADVVTHAVIDALLGALALPDIGEWFPDGDPRYCGIDSILLLKDTVEQMHRMGYEIANLDVTIVCERPHLGQWKTKIAQRLAAELGCGLEQISIKAKTNEGVDAVGRGEAIAVFCVCLLASREGPVLL